MVLEITQIDVDANGEIDYKFTFIYQDKDGNPITFSITPDMNLLHYNKMRIIKMLSAEKEKESINIGHICIDLTTISIIREEIDVTFKASSSDIRTMLDFVVNIR